MIPALKIIIYVGNFLVTQCPYCEIYTKIIAKSLLPVAMNKDKEKVKR